MNYANVARDALANVGNNFAQIRTSDRFANLRPVQECTIRESWWQASAILTTLVLDVRRISKPNGIGEIQQRISYNLGRYSSNYSVIFALLALYALITNPLLLFVIALAVGGMLGIGKLAGDNLVFGYVFAKYRMPLSLVLTITGQSTWRHLNCILH